MVPKSHDEVTGSKAMQVPQFCMPVRLPHGSEHDIVCRQMWTLPYGVNAAYAIVTAVLDTQAKEDAPESSKDATSGFA